MSFVEASKNEFHILCNEAFSLLKGKEELSINLNGESSEFIRFNGAKIRQATHVEQNLLEFNFQDNGRKVSFSFFMTGDKEMDKKNVRSLINRCRQECEQSESDPYQSELSNAGESLADHVGSLPKAEQALQQIIENTRDQDLAGLFASGPVIRANRNSKGQSHWFSTESFFLDYSLFTKTPEGDNKAVKGTYAGQNWNSQDLQIQMQTSVNRLNLLRRPNKKLSPGKYRTYLAPAATAELVSMLSWNALSFGAMKKGRCALQKVYEGKIQLSTLFSIRENFGMGLCPRFNSRGELAPEVLPLITEGKITNMLVSSRSAKEHSVPSNNCEVSSWGTEYLRSPEILPGRLAPQKELEALGTGLYLGQLHYLNWSEIPNARFTGMTRYACFWVEKGEIISPIQDLRFDETLFHCLGSELEAVGANADLTPSTDTYSQRALGGIKAPGLLLGSFNYTL